MLRPVFAFLENVELEYPDNLLEEEETELDGYESPENVVSSTNQIFNIPFGSIVIAAVVIAVILFIYFYFKNRDVVTEEKTAIRKNTFADTTKKRPEERRVEKEGIARQ